MGSKQSPAAITEAERLAKEVLQKNPNHIEGHVLMVASCSRRTISRKPSQS